MRTRREARANHGQELLLGTTLLELHGVAVEHGLRGVHARDDATGTAHHDALLVHGSEVLTTLLLALSKGDIDGLVAEHLAVHLSDGAGGLLRRGKAHKAKATGSLGLLIDSELQKKKKNTLALVSEEGGREGKGKKKNTLWLVMVPKVAKA